MSGFFAKTIEHPIFLNHVTKLGEGGKLRGSERKDNEKRGTKNEKHEEFTKITYRHTFQPLMGSVKSRPV